MGLNFPATPLLGDVYPTPAVLGVPQYTWDGEKWRAGTGSVTKGGGPVIYISDTPPPDAIDGSFWWESDTGVLYLRFNDGTSTQWVVAAPQPDVTQFVGTFVQTFTAPQQAQARSNIYAAPFDAVAFNGMQINGGFDVAQERGNGPAGGMPGNGWAADGNWYFAAAGGIIFNSGVTGASASPIRGVQNYLYMVLATAKPTLAATDQAQMAHFIEGYRWARLAWGTANAQPITIAFWSFHNITGVYSIYVQNAAGTRSYVAPYTQRIGTVPQYNVITVPGCTDGAWPATNVRCACVGVTLAAGSTYVAPAANVWSAGLYMAAPGQVNAAASTPNGCFIAGFVVLPGTQAPSSDQLPFIMRPFESELVLSQRYWEKSFGYFNYGGAAVSPGSGGCLFMGTSTSSLLGGAYEFKVRKRISPTVKIWDNNAGIGLLSAFTASGWRHGIAPVWGPGATEVHMNTGFYALAGDNLLNFDFTADARL